MIAIAGGHGNIALHLTGRLSERGERVVALIRKPEHAGDVRAAGGAPVLCDLEQADVPEISLAIAGASAVVFAAGAGPGSSAERKLTARSGCSRRRWRPTCHATR
jgi:nucleoside-diphosphate-sugar epimerase